MCLNFIQDFSPQSKNITEKFFPEINLEINTPAFKKEKGLKDFTDLLEEFVDKDISPKFKVLFIDEAYSLGGNDEKDIYSKDSFGKRLDKIVKGALSF